MANKKYKVKNTNLLHDGSIYKIGDVIELDEKQAKKLGDVLTYISDVKVATKAETKTETKTATTKTNKTKAEVKTEITPATETGDKTTETTETQKDGGAE